HHPAAWHTEIRPIMGQKAALAAEPAEHWYEPHWHVPFSGACANQRNHPADDRPAEEEVHEENAHRVSLVPPDERRQEVQQDRENQEKHFRTPSALIRPKASTPTPP